MLLGRPISCFASILLLPVIAMTAPAGAAAAPAPLTFADMRVLDGRVETIGHRLAVAARDLCADQAWRPGFALQDLSQFAAADRPVMIRLFGLDAGPGVQALAADGPAARVGLQTDDVLLAIDGAASPAGALPTGASFDRMEAILALVDQGFADGVAVLRVRRGGAEREVRIAAERGCASRFQLVRSNSLSAQADGRYVQVTTGFGAYAPDDTGLAAVMAHELAHNILRHRARLDAAGVQRGLLGNFGRNARLIRETEDEADRLGVYILERAGYDLDAALAFWERFGRRGLNLIGTPTHGSWRTRITVIREEIANVRRARAAGQVPMPDFLSPPPGGTSAR